jgi:hypothetical protein
MFLRFFYPCFCLLRLTRPFRISPGPDSAVRRNDCRSKFILWYFILGEASYFGHGSGDSFNLGTRRARRSRARQYFRYGWQFRKTICDEWSSKRSLGSHSGQCETSVLSATTFLSEAVLWIRQQCAVKPETASINVIAQSGSISHTTVVRVTAR